MVKPVTVDATTGEVEIAGEEIDSQELIESMVRDAEKAAEPGSQKPGTVVHKGDEEAPAPMVLHSVESAGFVTIYDTRTREPSLTNRNMLRAQLGKKREDGSVVFTTQKPRVPAKRGTMTCLLHPDRTERGHFDEIGFGACRKSNLVSAFQVERHMQARHKTEWATIKQERQESRENERWEMEKLVLGRAASETKAEPVGAGKKK